MNRRIILSPDARADIGSAARWYQREQASLSFRFRAEIRSTLQRIARYPYAYPRVDDEFRCAVMLPFPYYIFFTLDPDTVVVMAVVHQHRADRLDETQKGFV